MDTRQLTDTLVADLDPTTRPVVTAYLRELAAALPGSRRTREAILTEIADGLIEQITNTTGPDPASRRRDRHPHLRQPPKPGGPVRPRTHRKDRSPHRFRVGRQRTAGRRPLVARAHPGRTATPSPWTLPERIVGMFTALPLIPVLLLIIIPAALVAVAGAGRASRILPVTTGTAGFAALVAGTRLRHRRCHPDRARPDGGCGLVAAVDRGRHDQHGPAQPGGRGGTTLRPAPGRRLTAPFRINAHQVSGTPTSVGNTQYATVGSRSHSGNWGPLST